MRILFAMGLAAAMAAALAWSVWWFVGSAAATRAAENWVAARRAQGWTAEASRATTGGFPNRFDTTLGDVVLGLPGGWRASADFAQVLRLSYGADHLIVVLPDRVRLATPAGRVALRSDRFRASVVRDAGLDRLAVVVDAPAVVSGSATVAHAAQARLATRGAVAEGTHEVGLSVSGLTLPDAAGDATWMLEAHAALTLDEGGTRSVRLVLDRFVLSSGARRLTASGALRLATDGRASGEIVLAPAPPGDATATRTLRIDAGTVTIDGRYVVKLPAIPLGDD